MNTDGKCSKCNQNRCRTSKNIPPGYKNLCIKCMRTIPGGNEVVRSIYRLCEVASCTKVGIKWCDIGRNPRYLCRKHHKFCLEHIATIQSQPQQMPQQQQQRQQAKSLPQQPQLLPRSTAPQLAIANQIEQRSESTIKDAVCRRTRSKVSYKLREQNQLSRMPFSFSAKWKLSSHSRRIALIMLDVQEEYRLITKRFDVLPNMIRLITLFREKEYPIIWSSFARVVEDNLHNSMDRFFGNERRRGNGLYVSCKAGLKPMKEVAPTKKEKDGGQYISSVWLDLFWNQDDQGKSIIDEKLKALKIDTVVIVGFWTDECVLSTAFSALHRNYDVVVIEDATGTGTDQHNSALKIIGGIAALVTNTAHIVEFIQNSE